MLQRFSASPEGFARPALGLAAFLLAAVLAPAHVLAQAAPGSIELGGGAGGFFGGTFARGTLALSGQKLQADTQSMKAFWVGAQLSQDWAVEVAVRRVKTQLVVPASGVLEYSPYVAGLDLASVEGFGFRSFRLGHFLPYVGGGIGFSNIDPNTTDPANRDSNRLCISIGAGARFYVTRWLGARVDVRGRAAYLGSRDLGEDQGWSDTGRWFKNAELLGGVFMSFGGTR